jgi:predicted ATPase
MLTSNAELYIRRLSMIGDIPENNYLFSLPVIKYLRNNYIDLEKAVTFIVGENGTGKSTLIEAIAVTLDFNPEGGTKNFSFSTEDSHSELYKYIAVGQNFRKPKDGFFLRAESFYNAATYIDEITNVDPRMINYYGGKSLHRMSHGESFMACMENRFGGNGLYILDEPEAALSPMKLMRLMCIINELVERNSQFIISTHSPILMTFPDADILQIEEEEIKRVTFRETEHYQLTKRFIENPERMLKYLL